MRVQVLYFAVVRERLRRSDEEVELSEGATVATLLDDLCRRHPALVPLRRVLAVARNRETVPVDTRLGDGDEIALIPPVSGGADPPRVAVKDTPLSLDEVVRLVAHEGAGGIVTFTGNVRRQSRGKTVVRLEYEAYGAMAEARLGAIVAELEAADATGGTRLAVHHRTGTLAVGEAAVVIAASAPHRAAAFDACRACIERLKVEVPIWKKEIADDGEEWIGLGP